MTDEKPPRTGGENEGIEGDVASQGGEGRRAADTTPPIGEDAEPGQTAVPASEGDVGVPDDETLAREEDGAQ